MIDNKKQWDLLQMGREPKSRSSGGKGEVKKDKDVLCTCAASSCECNHDVLQTCTNKF